MGNLLGLLPGIETEDDETLVEDRAAEPASVDRRITGLINCVDDFLGLKITENNRLNHQIAISGMHSLCAAVLRCEAAAIPRAQILDVIEPARIVHGMSPFINRLQTWPRGYPGDFETIEYLCEAKNKAPDQTLQYYCEEYALKCAVAQQHRNKVALQSEKILRTLFRSEKRKRILCIAPNNAMDLRLIKHYLGKTPHEFVLLDADEATFDFTRRHLGEILPQCVFLSGFATLPPTQKRLKSLGPFDLIVTGGVFDYLKDKHIVRLIRFLYNELLSDRGELLFTNMDAGNPFRTWMEYLVTWIIIERSSAEIDRLVRESGISGFGVKAYKEATGLTHIIELRKDDAAGGFPDAVAVGRIGFQAIRVSPDTAV